MSTSPAPEPDVTGAYAPPKAPGERFAPGEVLAGRYRVVAVLGRGGMGEVYRADDLALGQAVALKFLPAHFADDPQRLDRFRKEVAAARRVSHPNVCRVYDIADHAGEPFLSMEFVDGEDLAALLKRVGRLSDEKALEVARQLCAALAAVHDQGLLHRDLKPANVMLDGRGAVRLTDFGLAAAAQDVTATEIRSGTPLYQAPEQAAGTEVTVRSDVYALGLVLYEVFTGRRPYPDVRRDRPPSKPSTHVSGLNPVVEAVILRCLEAAPDDRPAGASAVLVALPGGDPLAAALAAGQTPSPQAVADAGESGLISVRVGVALLAALAVGLAVFFALAPEVMAFQKAGGLPHSTEWLGGKARDVREMAGYPDGRATAVGYDFDTELIDWVFHADQSPDRWDRLTRRPAAPVAFWYRESPTPLLPGLFYPYSGSVETTRVTWADPPPTVPGMTGVRLAADGRLLELYAVPAEPDAPAAAPPDWAAWFRKAHLSPADFRLVTGRAWVPPVAVEEARTWEPLDPADESLPARVEAGLHRGRVAWFRVTPAWHVPTPREAHGRRAEQGIGDQGSALGLVHAYGPLVVAVVVLAPAALRSGRADRGGAFRLGAAVFAAMMVVWGLETRHVFRWRDEVQQFVLGVSAALYWGALTGFSYLVLEPFVRRLWPGPLISWSRLMVGRWRDPLVGRDVLVGAAAGVVWTVALLLANQLPRWAGGPAPAPLWDWWVPNSQVPGLWAGNFLMNLVYSFRFAFFYTLLPLLLLRVVLRRPWAAGVGFVALFAVSMARNLQAYSPSAAWGAIVLWQVLLLLTVEYGGVVAAVVAYLVMNTLWYPMTTDPARDYFGSGLVALATVVGPALVGFYAATGGAAAWRHPPPAR